MRKKIKQVFRSSPIVIFLLLLSHTVIAPAPYNTTNLTEANNLYETTLQLNKITDGSIGIGIILTLFIITAVIISGNTRNIVNGIAAGGFISLLSSMIMLPLEMISFNIFSITLIITGAAIFASFIID